ncbi:hypothetical protein HDV06_000989 [Boothiomyces sp. JEL0866]|nr:hypothetical protein HDV06_000989 [Boothiomyces sp. JEL0866]
MSAKGKKKGKKEKAPKEASPGILSLMQEKLAEQQEQRTLEYYQVKVSDLMDKLERMKAKNENLQKENTTLARTQAKFYSDKQDIVEFLNIKVGEHERMIASLESKNRTLDQEKRDMELHYQTQLANLEKSSQLELENLNQQCQKFKAELVELSSFSAQKDDMEEQLKQFKILLEKKENEYRETVHNLERKVLQDKSQMKREMLQKVNEAVANFRRVADQQMAETTKRAIRENMSITAQLKKMSLKTVEFISENEALTEKMKKLKTTNSLLMESERELAKRNHANQKVIKMLVEKLKGEAQLTVESDQMLEIAFDDPNYDPFQAPKEYLTEEMIEEIRGLQDDYNILADRLGTLPDVESDLRLIIEEAQTAIESDTATFEVLDYIQSNLQIIADRLNEMTQFDDDVQQSIQESQESASQSEQEYYEEYEQDSNVAQSASASNQSLLELQSEEEEDEESVGMIEQGSITESQQQLDSVTNSLKESEFPSKHDLESEDLEFPEGYEEEPFEIDDSEASTPTLSKSSKSGNKSIEKIQAVTLTPRKPGQELNMYQRKIEQTFLKMIEPTKKFVYDNEYKPDILSFGTQRTIGIQTNPFKFGPPVNTEYLLGEVRPWGPKAECLPPKGLGMYVSRNHQTQMTKILTSAHQKVKNETKLPPVVSSLKTNRV